MREAGLPKLVLRDNREGWGGEGSGRGSGWGKHVHLWLIHAVCGKIHHNIVKELASN